MRHKILSGIFKADILLHAIYKSKTRPTNGSFFPKSKGFNNQNYLTAEDTDGYPPKWQIYAGGEEEEHRK